MNNAERIQRLKVEYEAGGIVQRLNVAYQMGYATARLETVREWIPDYDAKQLSRINGELEQLREPYRDGGFLERIAHTKGWKKGRRDRTRTHWQMANL